MTRSDDNLAHQIDQLIDGAAQHGPATPDMRAALYVLAADAEELAPMPNALDVRRRVLEGITAPGARAPRSTRRRGAVLGRRVAVHAMVAVLACGSTAAVAGTTDTRVGEFVRAATKRMHLPTPPAPARKHPTSAEADRHADAASTQVQRGTSSGGSSFTSATGSDLAADDRATREGDPAAGVPPADAGLDGTAPKLFQHIFGPPTPGTQFGPDASTPPGPDASPPPAPGSAPAPAPAPQPADDDPTNPNPAPDPGSGTTEPGPGSTPQTGPGAGGDKHPRPRRPRPKRPTQPPPPSGMLPPPPSGMLPPPPTGSPIPPTQPQ